MKLVYGFLYCVIGISVHPDKTIGLGSKNMNSYRRIEEVPYVALILRPLDVLTTNSYCGAAILSEYWLITAASCFFKNKSQDSEDVISIRNNFKIWTGVDTLPYGKTMYEIESVEIPPYRSSTSFIDNFALINLKESIRFGNKREPIFIAKKNELPMNGDLLQIYGFPITKENDIEFLGTTSMSMIDSKTCFENNPSFTKLKISPQDKLFCGKVDSNFREFSSFITGSPVVFNEKLVGIVLNEKITTKNGSYVIITSVPVLYDWIIDPTNHPRPDQPFFN